MINSTVNRVIFEGNGQATAFSFPFKIFDRSDVKLLRINADGSRENVTTDYYVDMKTSIVHYPGYAPGAQEPEVDVPTILGWGDKLVIYRELPIVQLDRMPAQWPFDVNEQMHDKSCIIDQQLNDAIERSLKLDLDVPTDFDATFPIQAGYGWCVSPDGKRIIPLKNADLVLAETEKVYANTVAVKDAAEALRNETINLRNDAAAAKEDANADRWLAEAAKEQAVAHADEAAKAAVIAEKAAEKTNIYDPETGYTYGDAVMVANGDVYRCIAVASLGEDPATSIKWVKNATVVSETFEMDENGDLMPCYPAIGSANWELDVNGDIMVKGR